MFKRLWNLVRRERREPIQIEINVVEQIVLKHLIRFESAAALDLIQEAMSARATVTDDQVRLSLIRLESLRLIAREENEPAEDDRGRRYRVTPDGRRLKAVLQDEPTSRIQTYL